MYIPYVYTYDIVTDVLRNKMYQSIKLLRNNLPFKINAL